MLNTIRYLVLPVLNASGPVLICLAAAIMIPLLYSISVQDGAADSFTLCLLITLSTGIILSLGTRQWRRELTARHGFLLVTLIWTAVPLFGTIPFIAECPDMSFAQLYFEMMSCLTTTGATVFSGLDNLAPSLNGWRCFLSWIGGMGLIVLSVAILPLLGVGGAQIIKAETTGPMKESRLTPRIADTAKALYLIYLGLSVACTISYHLAGMRWNDAVMHMMTTVSLSGIAAHDASFAYFNSPSVDTVAIIFMLISGFNFSLHFVCWKRKNFLVYFQDAEARSWVLTTVLVAALTIIVLADAGVYETSSDTVRYALFSVVSMVTTTGYATADYSTWPLGLPFILILAASFATCAGSTGGGIKMIRLLIVLGMIRREMTKLIYPNAVVPLTLNKTPIESAVSSAVLAYLMVWILSFIIGAGVLLLAGLPSLDAITASWAMLTNLGPGLGGIGPSGNFSGLTDIQLSVCSFLMLIGRLEIFTVFAIFTSYFWRI